MDNLIPHTFVEGGVEGGERGRGSRGGEGEEVVEVLVIVVVKRKEGGKRRTEERLRYARF